MESLENVNILQLYKLNFSKVDLELKYFFPITVIEICL